MHALDAVPDTPPRPSDQTSPREVWDRRRRDLMVERAREVLEHATRYLVHDQMQGTRVYHPGALDAVALLWSKLDELGTQEVAQQRIGRLSAEWLPKHALARARRDEELPN